MHFSIFSPQSLKSDVKAFAQLLSLSILSLSVTINHAFAFGNALSFDGLNTDNGGDYVSLPSLTGTAPLPFTLELWVKPDGSQRYWGSAIATRTGNSAIALSFDGGKLCFIWDGTWGCTSNSVLDTSGKWQHLAVVLKTSSPTINAYRDGVLLQSTNPTLGAHDLSSNTFRLGHDSHDVTRTYKGLMDEVRIWSVDKTADITNQSYRCSPSLSNTTGLLLHYKFDEGTGTTTANSSGTTHDGTLTNSPTWVTSTILTDTNSPCYVPPPTSAPLFSLEKPSVFFQPDM